MTTLGSKNQKKVMLVVLDGFGDGKDYPFNAIQNAKMPFYKDLRKKFPRSQLITCGEAVGLPDKVMGNSEVGHMNMGAGRIVYQDLTRINKSIREGSFAKNGAFLEILKTTQKNNSRLHVMGLFSDAGVHSTTKHLEEIIKSSGPLPIILHLFTDGRDTPPTSSLEYLEDLKEFLKNYPNVYIGSLGGRYFGMDRDTRWERVEQAYLSITGKTPITIKAENSDKNGVIAAKNYLVNNHQNQKTDEFIPPAHFLYSDKNSAIQDNDTLIFFNFRSDRAREITRALTENQFSGFKVDNRPKLAHYLCMTQYDKNFTHPTMFPTQNLDLILPEILVVNHLNQFRIAETEKYAHVTFFFNGGRENPYQNENRSLIPSPKDVPTYDLKPEMSAFEVTENLVKAIESNQHHFILVNYANPDMVGHTGNYTAAIQALVALDQCLEKAITAAFKAGYETIITADHGNIEEMEDEDHQPHTQHTLNPVPMHLISQNKDLNIRDGILADIAPTILDLLGLKQPNQMTQKSLLIKK